MAKIVLQSHAAARRQGQCTDLRLVVANGVQHKSALGVVQQTELVARLLDGHNVCNAKEQMSIDECRGAAADGRQQSTAAPERANLLQTPAPARTHEARGEPLVCAGLAVDLDELLHADHRHLATRQGVFEAVPQNDDQRQGLTTLSNDETTWAMQ